MSELLEQKNKSERELALQPAPGEMSEIQFEAMSLLASREQVAQPEVYTPERIDNARTALMEALTASGHLSRIELVGDTPQAIHEQVVARLVNGCDDSLPSHEKTRRFYELCEELYIHRTHQQIQNGELPETTAVAVISDYPDSLPDAQAQELGYRSKNKKGMVRSTHLLKQANGQYVRIIEQVSRSNSHDDSSRHLLREFNGPASSHGPKDIAVLQKPFQYDISELEDGVVDLQRRLDAYAGPNVTYGEVQADTHVVYEQVRAVSQQREQQIDSFTQRLADFEKRLDQQFRSGNITAAERDGQYQEEVHQILRAICVLAPEYSEDCFGKQAAQYYQQAANYELTGDTYGRDQMLSAVRLIEEAVSFCGVSINATTAKKLGVDIDNVDDLLMEEKKNWRYREGYCRVTSCGSRPKKTQVGPCDVCKNCEKKFDSGVLK